MTKVGWYAIDKSTTLESNKSHGRLQQSNAVLFRCPATRDR
jgi:hypothetical protein